MSCPVWGDRDNASGPPASGSTAEVTRLLVCLRYAAEGIERFREKPPIGIPAARRQPPFRGAWCKRNCRGRSPDLQVSTIPAAFPFLAGTVAFEGRLARCLQWRDRAGFTPASLLTHHRRCAPR